MNDEQVFPHPIDRMECIRRAGDLIKSLATVAPWNRQRDIRLALEALLEAFHYSDASINTLTRNNKADA